MKQLSKNLVEHMERAKHAEHVEHVEHVRILLKSAYLLRSKVENP